MLSRLILRATSRDRASIGSVSFCVDRTLTRSWRAGDELHGSSYAGRPQRPAGSPSSPRRVSPGLAARRRRGRAADWRWGDHQAVSGTDSAAARAASRPPGRLNRGASSRAAAAGLRDRRPVHTPLRRSRLRLGLVLARRRRPGVRALGHPLLEPGELRVHLEQLMAQLAEAVWLPRRDVQLASARPGSSHRGTSPPTAASARARRCSPTMKIVGVLTLRRTSAASVPSRDRSARSSATACRRTRACDTSARRSARTSRPSWRHRLPRRPP